MRVALIVHDSLPLPGEPATSTGLRAWNLALALRATPGVEVVIATPPAPSSATIPWVHPVERRALSSWLNEQQADIVVACDWRLVADLGDNKVPLAVDIGAWPFDASATGNAAVDQWRAFGAALARADRVLVANAALGAALAPFLGAARADDLVIDVPLGMAPDAPAPAADRHGHRVLAISNGRGAECVVGAAQLLAEATASISGAHITIACVGGSPMPLAEQLPGDVEVIAAPEFGALLSTLRSTDLAVVMPPPHAGLVAQPATWQALCLWAGVPLVMLEANDATRAVAAAKAGWLVDAADETAIRRQVAKALASPTELGKRATAAQAFARQHLTWTNTLGPLLAWCHAPNLRGDAPSFAAPMAQSRTIATAPHTDPLQPGESRDTPLGRITLHLEPPLPPAHPRHRSEKHDEGAGAPTLATNNGGRPLTIPTEPGERVLSPMAVLVALPVGIVLLGVFLVLETIRAVVSPPEERHARAR